MPINGMVLRQDGKKVKVYIPDKIDDLIAEGKLKVKKGR